jgi:hypothetical protein
MVCSCFYCWSLSSHEPLLRDMYIKQFVCIMCTMLYFVLPLDSSGISLKVVVVCALPPTTSVH